MTEQITYTDIFEAVKKVVPPIVQIYLVGGAVRDIILGKQVHDFDFVIEGLARPVGKKIAKELNGKYYVMDDDRNMVRIMLNPDTSDCYCIDISPIRGDSLEEDLYGRDFTINAMAIDFIQKNKIIDPMGGANDLKEKQLRMCNLESLQSDPLRGMRAIRMAVEYELSMDTELVQALKDIRPYLPAASMERYRDELFKILSLQNETAVLKLLDQYGFLDYLFHDPYGTDFEILNEHVRSFEHLSRILTQEFNEAESSNLLSGMAVLKLGQFREQFNSFFYQDPTLIHDRSSLMLFSLILRFYRTQENPASMIEILKTRCNRLLLSTAEMNLITKSYSAMVQTEKLFSLEENSNVEIYRYFRSFGSAGIDGIFLRLIAIHTNGDLLRDSSDWTNALDHAVKFMDAWFNGQESIIDPKPLLTGDQISALLSIPAGPKIGKIKQALIEAELEGKVSSYDEAVALVKGLG